MVIRVQDAGATSPQLGSVANRTPDDIHIPVMLDRCVDVLSKPLSRPGAVYVDGTLGMAGHTSAILSRFPDVTVVGIDRDPHALALARQRLGESADRAHLVQARFDELSRVLKRLQIPVIDAMLLDLGLSSLQIDQAERGFAYSVDAPLDMRMNPDDPVTAADVVNGYSVDELTRIFTWYGEEKHARRIAEAIVAKRKPVPILRSGRLVELIVDTVGQRSYSRGKHARSGHPAKRVFQALRMEVNAEREALEAVLPAALNRLAIGGRLAVLSYHSGEDRLVKRCFVQASSDHVPDDLPFVPKHHLAEFAMVTRGAEKPSREECQGNPRASSARLRVIERVLDHSLEGR